MRIFSLGVLFLVASCGLFEKRYPPKGIFCNVLEKPPRCIFIDFQAGIFRSTEGEVFSIQPMNRVEYIYRDASGSEFRISVLTENRVRFSDGTFYIRKRKSSNDESNTGKKE